MARQENISFEKAIKLLKSAAKRTMYYANMTAVMALEHLAEHNNTTKLTTVLEALPENFVRRTAFVKWAVTFAPVKLEGKKFLLDPDRKGEAVNLDGARAKPFWEFNPAQPLVNFTADDLLANVKSLIKRHENQERMKPADEKAEATLRQLKAAVETIHVPQQAESIEQGAAQSA